MYVPSLNESSIITKYHVDGYPDDMQWWQCSSVVLGGGNYSWHDEEGNPIKEYVSNEDFINFSISSMIHENIDIIFQYGPYTDLVYLNHYLEQDDGSYELKKRQKANLYIYEVFFQEFSFNPLTFEGYEFDEENENNVTTGAAHLRQEGEENFSYNYYYKKIKETETPTPTPT